MAHVRELFDLSGRVAVVTGGSRGLGLEIAEGLGEAGARVVVAARRAQWLGPAEDHLRARGIEVSAVACDVADPEQARRLVQGAVDRFGRLDVLVNNAGVSWGAPLEEMPLERWRHVLDVNLTGTFLVTQAAVPVMKAAGWGRIVNVASVAGLVGSPAEILDAVGYAASKGGVVALTRDLAVKLAPFGITVNAVAPGFFPTRMSEKLLERVGDQVVSRVPMGRLGREGDLKGVVVFLASEAARYVTGQVLAVDGGSTAV
ncbi:MAG: SDR family oxidoreductase [Armatimonadota bacterium]|nr:SDR family oxidoreductase [Armatimonadota bacterium]MDR7577997.1 SDR family oxidoreductase [Armatimonadota bacterium]MDR7589413.1 SDR family oxidoreductase [Armatimonadota bacterium]MDR7595084.1 SDR family oxidoreductase [Armatimonadota bacterium]